LRGAGPAEVCTDKKYSAFTQDNGLNPLEQWNAELLSFMSQERQRCFGEKEDG